MSGSFENLYESIRNSCQNCSIIKQDEHEVQAEGLFCFERDFSGFKGHFPGMPILPAMVQIAAVRCLAELLLLCEVHPIRYRKTKFRGVVRPEERISIHLRMLRNEQDPNVWSFEFSLKNELGEVLATGQGELAEKEVSVTSSAI
ncbi:beta-hydroxyacyl-ACP dehydratase [Desulfosediminicola ganghwensis]|uniref:beta-hydroxyacyl-ACP dehydratase n=1 Tax=Desulfosediminicola ganghwensis TaxID=2569540 RepID=UPI0010AD34B6|nr:beta-hydroxyacyl-ACP dehydratase [Desulfosediminicola ganghwensis]